MNNSVVYNYPKSSCDCYDCNNQDFSEPSQQIPSNMSVKNCDFDKKYWNCFDTKPFRADIEPVDKRGRYPINPSVLTDKYSKGFATVSSPGEYKQVTAPFDGRIIDNARGKLLMRFHNPPIDGSVPLDKIYTDPILNDYGKHYRTYSDVNSGQILYYNDASIEDPFFGPNFVSSAWTDGYLYKDPMGAMKPQYLRTPVRNDNPIGSIRNNYEGDLSWMQDSLSHRQDIMGLQMRKANEQRWMPRWNNSNI